MNKQTKYELAKEPLLRFSEPVVNGENFSRNWPLFGAEIRKQLQLALPVIGMNLLQSSLQIISLMFVGHLDGLALSGASIATSFINVTGYSFVVGMACGLETLCGQAYGAGQYRLVGILMQRAVITLLFVCIPLSVMWMYMEHVLLILGQDPFLSKEAGLFSRWMIPSLFSYAFIQPLVKFLQAQSIVMPVMSCSALVVIFHIPLCWFLILMTGLGSRGAALAIDISYWLNVLLLCLYIMFSTACSKTRVSFSKQAFHDIKGFLQLAVPSAFMICLEWWSCEIIVLLSGVLPDPELQTSVLSICLYTATFVYMIPFGLGAAASTRVSNELGAGNTEGALLAVHAVVYISAIETMICAIVLFMLRNVWGLAFSTDPKVTLSITTMMPILAISSIVDGFQGILSGIARGCGQQKWGAIANLAAYYVVGIPVAAILAFDMHLGVKGLWLGIFGGLSTQTCLLFLIAWYTNWNKETTKARERLKESVMPVDDIEEQH